MNEKKINDRTINMCRHLWDKHTRISLHKGSSAIETVKSKPDIMCMYVCEGVCMGVNEIYNFFFLFVRDREREERESERKEREKEIYNFFFWPKRCQDGKG